MEDVPRRAAATSAVRRMRATPAMYGDGEAIPKDAIRDVLPGASDAEVEIYSQWLATRSAEIYADDLEAGRLAADAAELRRVARRLAERKAGLARAISRGHRERRDQDRHALPRVPHSARNAGASRPREHRSSCGSRRRGPPTTDDPSDDPPPSSLSLLNAEAHQARHWNNWPDSPASAFQAAHRAILPLTARELDDLVVVCQIRASWMRMGRAA